MTSKEAREAVYRQVGIETASTSRRATEQSQVKPLTIDTPTGAAKQMELGSPMTKMRRVTMSQEATPSVSREPSQTEQRGGLINLTKISDKAIDDSNFGDEEDHDLDQIEMQVIQRNN